MALGLSISADFARLEASFKSKAGAIAGVMKREDFGNAVQSHLVGVTTRMVRQLGDIGDAPQANTARGVTWRGWARWTTKKYGRIFDETTRGYWRGYRKGKAKAKTVASRRRKAREKAAHGLLAMEWAWRKRASGKRYSASSKMMRDTGHLLGLTAFVRRKGIVASRIVWGSSLILRAGQQVAYFKDQHDRRPIWFVDPATDGPRIKRLMEETIRRIAVEGRP